MRDTSRLSLAPYYLVRKGAESTEFDTMAALYAAVRAAGIQVSQRHTPPDTPYPCGSLASTGEWIVRNVMGECIEDHEIRQHGGREPWRTGHGWSSARLLRQLHAQALGLPIPHTGCRRRRLSGTMRHPSYIGIHREASLADIERSQPGQVYPARAVHMPPSDWDDLMRSDQGHRSWKRTRARQWIARNPG